MLEALKTWARSIRRDAHALYLAARDPRTPWYAKAVALAGAAYALSPIGLIPDFIPVLGHLDELLGVPLGILTALALVPGDVMSEHRETAARAAERPISRGGAIVIGLAWIASIGLAGWLAWPWLGL